MTPCIDHGCVGMGLGYATGWIRLPDGRKISTTKHRKVYYEATGDLPPVVRHKCDNPRCVNLEHLEPGTRVDNMRDMHERGRANQSRPKEVNGRAILNAALVATIRARYVKGSRAHGLPALSHEYGVSIAQLWRVVTDKHWVKEADTGRDAHMGASAACSTAGAVPAVRQAH